MEWVNITAKTLPEAIDLALDNLGVDESEAEIEVLEEPKQGLFGRTRGNARVRARVKPKATRPKVERGRGRKRRSETSAGVGAGSGAGTATGSRRSGGRSASNGRDEKRDNGAGTESDTTRSDAVAAESSAGDSGGRSESGRGSNGSSGGESKRKRSGGNRKRSSADPAEESNSQEATMEEVSEHLEGFLAGLTEAFGFDSDVAVEQGDDEVVASVDGRHGLMVGPRGRTLDAIQELARVSAQRSAPSSVRIKVDVGGYRDFRRGALEEFAVEAADAALADGKERELEPMSSADRKIIHDALSDKPEIETRSAGNEPHRRVVVVPLNAEVADDEDAAGDLDDLDDDVSDVAVVEADDDDAIDEVDQVDDVAELDDDDVDEADDVVDDADDNDAVGGEAEDADVTDEVDADVTDEVDADDEADEADEAADVETVG